MEQPVHLPREAEKKNISKWRRLLRPAVALMLGVMLLTAEDAHSKPPKIEPQPDKPGEPSTTTTPAESELDRQQESIPGPENLAVIDISPEVDFSQLQQRVESQLGFNLVAVDVASPEHLSRMETDDGYAASFLLDQVIRSYSNHGSIMSEIIRQVPQASTERSDFFKLQEALTQLYFYRDSLGNPHLGVYVDPEVIKAFVAETDAETISMSFQVGWGEFAFIAKEFAQPELFPYSLNGETVYADSDTYEVVVDEEGNESLVETMLQSFDINELEDEEKASFLKSSVNVWTKDEYDFLVTGGYITPEQGFFDEVEGYYNDTPDFLKQMQDDPRFVSSLPPRTNAGGSLFNRPVKKEVQTYSSDEAERIASNGIIEEKLQPFVQLTEPYTKDASFSTPAGEVQSQSNISDLTGIAAAFPNKQFIAAAGNVAREGSNLTGLHGKQPSNLVVVGAWFGDTNSVPGATYYVSDFNSSSEATAYVASRLAAAGLSEVGQVFLLETRSFGPNGEKVEVIFPED